MLYYVFIIITYVNNILFSTFIVDVSAIVSALAQEVDDMSSDESDTTSESQHLQPQHHQVGF